MQRRGKLPVLLEHTLIDIPRDDELLAQAAGGAGAGVAEAGAARRRLDTHKWRGDGGDPPVAHHGFEGGGSILRTHGNLRSAHAPDGQH